MSDDLVNADPAHLFTNHDEGFTLPEVEALKATGRILGLLWTTCDVEQRPALIEHVQAIQGIVTGMVAARQ